MAVAPGDAGSTNAFGSSRIYRAGSMTRPVHPCARLCGHSSCLSALMICFRSARTFAKSGHGETEGEVFRNSAASLMVIS
jgi:hypothetical protein